MSALTAAKVSLDKPMDRYVARRLADAIKSIAGYRVVKTYTAPASAGAYVVDVEDTITKLTYVVTGPQSWIDVRGETASARRHLAARNAFPVAHSMAHPASDVAGAPPEDPKPAPPTREEPKTMTQSPTPAQPSSGGFNFAQWETITRKAIENAEAMVVSLQTERGGLDEQVREAERRVKARRQEIDGQVAELRGTVKKLRRAIDVVDRPERAPATKSTGRSLVPKTGATAAKWAPIALDYAKSHGGEIDLKALTKLHNVPPSRFSDPLNRLVERGELTRLAEGLYRVVTT